MYWWFLYTVSDWRKETGNYPNPKLKILLTFNMKINQIQMKIEHKSKKEKNNQAALDIKPKILQNWCNSLRASCLNFFSKLRIFFHLSLGAFDQPKSRKIRDLVFILRMYHGTMDKARVSRAWMTSPTRDIYFHTLSRNQTKLGTDHYFLSEVIIFGICRQFFLRKNVFQTIFFSDENNF